MNNSNRSFIFCPRCGEKNLIGAKFCTHCGHSLANIMTSTSSERTTTANDSTEKNSNTATENLLGPKETARPNQQQKVHWKPILLTAIGIMVVLLAIIGGKALIDHRNQVNTAWYFNYEKKTGKITFQSIGFGGLRISGDRKKATILISSNMEGTSVLIDYKISQAKNATTTYMGTLTNATFLAYKASKLNQYQLLEKEALPSEYAVASDAEIAADEAKKDGNKNYIKNIKFQILKNKTVKIIYLSSEIKQKDKVIFKKRSGKDLGSAEMMQEKLNKQDVKKVSAFGSSSRK
ncbi:hypothetical protein Lpp78_08485 [Lacticaseibacillus paracasei subsp. paracasei CNCM I-2877]|nr:hypothetical protein Lpp78_08485 [Lacticaseibacillus paracasei subsp. paracasei CNCM I-2877]